MAKFPIPENCPAHVPMILKEFCSSKINGIGILKEWLVKYFFVHKNVFKAILVF
jgi:hypothetical protein